MSKTTTYLRNKWKDSLLTGQAFSVPALYVGIFTTLPTVAGNDGVEHAIDPSTTGYVRAAATNKWQSGTGEVLFENNDILNFESLNVTWDGTTNTYPIAGVGLWDAPTGGNCLAFAAINPARIIGVSQEMDIGVGALTVSWE